MKVKRALSRRTVVRIVLFAVLFLLLGGFAWKGSNTLQRANRLFRSGDMEGAADIYSSWIDTTRIGAIASFNLGNALAGSGSPQAERYLVRATEGGDSAAAQRAHYNLGYRVLTEADADLDPYVAIPLLAQAIRSNRAALQLDPDDEDARWNLALSLRRFDELPMQDFDEGPIEEEIESDREVSENEEENASSESEAEDPGDGTEESELPDEQGSSLAPAAGSPEALASGDPGPMTPEAAMRLVEGSGDDLGLMVRGLLWSLRPRTQRNQPPPGGDW
jgi:hypothetical protein